MHSMHSVALLQSPHHHNMGNEALQAALSHAGAHGQPGMDMASVLAAAVHLQNMHGGPWPLGCLRWSCEFWDKGTALAPSISTMPGTDLAGGLAVAVHLQNLHGGPRPQDPAFESCEG